MNHTEPVSRWYDGRRFIVETCWTSLQTLCIGVMLLLHREGDLCAVTLGSTVTLEPTGPFTSCELLHGGRKDKQSNGGLKAWSEWSWLCGTREQSVAWRWSWAPRLGWPVCLCVYKSVFLCVSGEKTVWSWHLWPSTPLHLYFMADRAHANATYGILPAPDLWPSAAPATPAASCTSHGTLREGEKECKGRSRRGEGEKNKIWERMIWNGM